MREDESKEDPYQAVVTAFPGREEIPAETDLAVSWTPPAYFMASSEFRQKVAQEIEDQVPNSILEAWAAKEFPKIKVNENGGKSPSAVRAYAEDRLAEINAARPYGSPNFSLENTSGPLDCMLYYWVGNDLVCVSCLGLRLGTAPWKVLGPKEEDPPACLEIRVAWKWPPQT